MGMRALGGVPGEEETDVDETLPRSSQSETSYAGCIVAMLVMLERSSVSFMIIVLRQAQSKSSVFRSEPDI